MDKDFYLGILVGLLGGAVAAANSLKVRRAVKEGQQQMMDAINRMDKNGGANNSNLSD